MKVDRITHARDMVNRNFPRWRAAAILDLVQPEVGPFDPPSPKTIHRARALNENGVGNIRNFQPISRLISETVQERTKVTIND